MERCVSAEDGADGVGTGVSRRLVCLGSGDYLGVEGRPVEVQVDGKVERVAMTDGRGTIAVGPDAHVVLDPAGRILKRSKALEEYKAWKARPPRSKY